MSQNSRFDIGAVKFGSTVIGGLTGQGFDLGAVLQGESTSGNLYPEHVSMTARNPTAQFGGYQLADLLDQSGIAVGTSINSMTGGFTLYELKHVDGGTRSASADNRSQVVNAGIVYPTSISVSHQQDATISYSVAPVYDGSNAIVAQADNVSAVTIPADDQRFTIGPVSIGDVALTHIRAIEISTGINVGREGSDSDIDPTFASVVNTAPMITLRGVDPTWLSSGKVPLDGLALTHANTSIKLRKRAQGGTFVADGTSEHIEFTAEGMAAISTFADGSSGGGSNEIGIQIKCRYDGTNVPITVDTSATIS